MKKFKLINHKSLGEGIVILNEGDGIGKVYIKDEGTKSMVLDHPMIGEYEGTIKDFIKAKLFEAIFDSFTKEKAKSYINSNHIIVNEYTNNLLTGTVTGSEIYSFTIEIKSSYLYLTCSCPVNGLCKHLYAIFKYLSDRDNVVVTHSNSNTKKKDESFSNNNNKKDSISSFNNLKTSKDEATKKLYLYKSNIESFLYDRGNFSYVDFFTIYDNITSKESFIDFISTLLIYYRRDQYRNRVSRELLPPLLFDNNINNYFQDYYQDNLDNADINNLFQISMGQLNNVILPNINKSSTLDRQYRLIKASIDLSLDSFINLKNTYYSYYSANDYIFSLAHLLKNKNLDKEEIQLLSNNELFRRYGSSVYNYYLSFTNNNIKGNNILLFLPYIRNIDDINIPIDYVLSSLDTASLNNLYLKTLLDKFNEIDKSYYSLIADYLIACSRDYSLRSKAKDMIYDLLDKLPFNSYLFDLIEHTLEKNNSWSRRY